MKFIRIRKKKFLKSDNGLPSHIAIIMDGNGRWAKKRLLPRSFGHREGIKTIDRIADVVFSLGVRYLTIFAFSTENWNRPEQEVTGLLGLFRKYLKSKERMLVERGIKLNVLGSRRSFDGELSSLVDRVCSNTAGGTSGTLNICFDYGGRADIIEAVNECVEKGIKADEKTFAEHLSTGGMPDPDIIIRTGGEHRISNFLLYQSAYSELFFTDTLWPDFSEKEINAIIAEYRKKDRRFGRINEE